MNFNELGLNEEILRALTEMGFDTPTEIQQKTIPLILAGEDVIGRSHTGTGKTAAFGLPAIQLLTGDWEKRAAVLILCPTRELAMQACDELEKFSKYMPNVRPCAIYGGAGMDRQIAELRRANIIVGTPGRIMDHLRRRTLRTDGIRMVILDEADEMLNMGFKEDIETILEEIPDGRQTILFSATMPPDILTITEQVQHSPVLVRVENPQRTVETISQYYYEVPPGKKTDALALLLSAYEPALSMIFCNTKTMVSELCDELTEKGFQVSQLHGDMKQLQRTQVMNAFKSGRSPILIATDVAARGIDVDDIDAVFNYDLPQDNEYYIHRIGRTGRAGKSGAAYTLICGRQQFYRLKDLSRFIKADIVRRELPRPDEIYEEKTKRFKEKLIESISEGRYEEYRSVIESMTDSGVDPVDIAAALIGSQFDHEKQNLPEEVCAVKRQGERRDSRSRQSTAKIDISAGKQQRIAPNFILGALVDATGMPGKCFGKIDIFDNNTVVEVPEADIEQVIAALDGGKINGNRVSVKKYDSRAYSDGRAKGRKAYNRRAATRSKKKRKKR